MGSTEAEKRVLKLGRLHARLEAERKLDPLMETLVAEPVYEFHPLGRRMSGGERVRRYYDQFFSEFMPRIESYALLDEWVNASSVVQEYDITVRDGAEPETHRVIGILWCEGDRLGGERIYGSDRIARLMLGELYTELEPL